MFCDATFSNRSFIEETTKFLFRTSFKSTHSICTCWMQPRLQSRMLHLSADMIGYNVDNAVISETHLKKKHTDQLFVIDGYSLFRRDRPARQGGGVAVYVNSQFAVSEWVSSCLTAHQHIKGHSVPFMVYIIEIIASYKIEKNIN